VLPKWQDYNAVYNNATLNTTLAPSGSVNGMGQGHLLSVPKALSLYRAGQYRF
jgi:hypothetical protein